MIALSLKEDDLKIFAWDLTLSQNLYQNYSHPNHLSVSSPRTQRCWQEVGGQGHGNIPSDSDLGNIPRPGGT